MMEQTSSADSRVHGPKALFWYLTLFFTLGITAFSTGGLWFQFINKFFPQEVVSGYVQQSFNQSALKWADASLIVAAPLFFLFSVLIRKALKSTALDPKNKVRTWITYIILFIAVATAVGDLITTVFRVLEGDFTARFILKSLTILAIVIWIFVYYWLELRSQTSLVGSNTPRTFMGVSVALIVVSFIGSFFVIDSPVTARAKAFDQTRTNNLQEISGSIDNYFQTNDSVLPKQLDELKTLNAYLVIVDPQTAQPYEYEVVDQKTYKLCAEFNTSNKEVKQENTNYYMGYRSFIHDAGKNCFEFKATPLNIDAQKLAPPIPVPVN